MNMVLYDSFLRFEEKTGRKPNKKERQALVTGHLLIFASQMIPAILSLGNEGKKDFEKEPKQ